MPSTTAAEAARAAPVSRAPTSPNESICAPRWRAVTAIEAMRVVCSVAPVAICPDERESSATAISFARATSECRSALRASTSVAREVSATERWTSPALSATRVASLANALASVAIPSSTSRSRAVVRENDSPSSASERARTL